MAHGAGLTEGSNDKQDWRAIVRVTPLGEADEGPDGGFGDGKDKAQDGTTGIKKKKKLNIICLRRSAYFKMAESKTFSTCVYVTIIASSIMLAFETPAEQVSRMHFFLLTPHIRASNTTAFI